MKQKPWYQSKTILVNGLVVLAGLATQTIATLPPESKTAMWTTVALAAINTGLRVVTKDAVKILPS